jgi:ferric-dicitrate binding protein FerR (iron transport regulator)
MIMINKAGRWLRALPVTALCATLMLGATACAPSPRLLQLPDGTEVFYLSNTKVQPDNAYPQVRQIKIDGEVFIRATAGEKPLVLRTRLLILTVTGRSALRVTARSKETGEEADVLYGQVEAKKAYPSRQNEPDMLLAGEEVMVNETIDLQEKETADLPTLRAWSENLVKSAQKKQSR